MRRRAFVGAAAFGAAFAFLSACDGMPGRRRAAEVEVRPDRVTSFAVLFAENCAGCHGPSGRGGAGALALANPVYLAIADDAAIRRAATQGVAKTAMPAFAQSAGGMLTEAQIEILVRGIRGWARPDALGGALPPPYFAPPGDAARGAEVYAKFCASCHGASGQGGAKAGSIVDGSFLGLVSDQSLRSTVIAGRPDLGQPDWRNDAPGEALGPADVSDVVAWLAAQRPANPGQPYAEAKP
ncbi:MAG TPA: c-type cytochrome [Thermoanaerobaculia bacterium]|nr:c-type cytochrome [Thermoanaerobaculia bacterium]